MSTSTADHPRELPAILSRRRLPVGAEIIGPQSVHFRVWAPAARRVEVVIDGRESVELSAEPGGYFSGASKATDGSRYQFRLDGGDRLYADPASRFQPDGPHGASQVVDPTQFAWGDEQWSGIDLRGQVIYEVHAGTFTPEGTWAAAAEQLPELASLGVTAIELMPIAEFDGRFGWGYDGVDLYAPSHLYGTPDELRALVNRAHQCGLGVILDVVYNHLGPSGNYLRNFAPQYFADRYENEWGDAINFDGEGSGPVRELLVENAGYWIDEFHFDGLRLDATQQIFDESEEHVLKAIGRRARERSAGRGILLIAENEPQDTRLIRSGRDGGYELDALWNDDFHHSALVALTGRAEAYYSDTRGFPQELVSAAKYGYLFQGQYYGWQRNARGTPALDIPPAQFVAYLQNHDQVANSAQGLRGHQLTIPGKWRAMTTLLLLMPATPMLFQGQEFSASRPFLYFADFDPELAAKVREGRAAFLRQFPSVATTSEKLADPADPKTFERCKLDFSERHGNQAAYQLHKDLLRMRRADPAFSRQRRGSIDGAVLGVHTFALRFFADRPEDERLLIVNLGGDLYRRSIAEPLLAPAAGSDWTLIFSSDDPRYGGSGAVEEWRSGPFSIPAAVAIVLAPADVQPPLHSPIRRRTA